MSYIVAGCFSFILFIIYDLNQLKGDRPLCRPFFAVGCLLLVLSTAGLSFAVQPTFQLAFWLRVSGGSFSLICLVLLIYSLFGALPFSNTYLNGAARRKVYDRGIYALCRHPGVLWFTLFYLSYWMIFSSSVLLWAGISFSLGNLLYAILQDLFFFPQIFANYNEYKKSTPFLIPTRSSIRRAASTIKVR